MTKYFYKYIIEDSIKYYFCVRSSGVELSADTPCRAPHHESRLEGAGVTLYAQLEQLDKAPQTGFAVALPVLLLWLAASHCGARLLVYNTNGNSLLTDLGRCATVLQRIFALRFGDYWSIIENAQETLWSMR